MNQQLLIAIAGIVVLVLAWKLLKGVLKVAIILAIIAAAAYFLFR
jgi:hypothetical protein